MDYSVQLKDGVDGEKEYKTAYKYAYQTGADIRVDDMKESITYASDETEMSITKYTRKQTDGMRLLGYKSLDARDNRETTYTYNWYDQMLESVLTKDSIGFKTTYTYNVNDDMNTSTSFGSDGTTEISTSSYERKAQDGNRLLAYSAKDSWDNRKTSYMYNDYDQMQESVQTKVDDQENEKHYRTIYQYADNDDMRKSTSFASDRITALSSTYYQRKTEDGMRLLGYYSYDARAKNVAGTIQGKLRKTEYTYDVYDRMLTSTQIKDGTNGEKTYKTAYTYSQDTQGLLRVDDMKESTSFASDDLTEMSKTSYARKDEDSDGDLDRLLGYKSVDSRDNRETTYTYNSYDQMIESVLDKAGTGFKTTYIYSTNDDMYTSTSFGSDETTEISTSRYGRRSEDGNRLLAYWAQDKTDNRATVYKYNDYDAMSESIQIKTNDSTYMLSSLVDRVIRGAYTEDVAKYYRTIYQYSTNDDMSKSTSFASDRITELSSTYYQRKTEDANRLLGYYSYDARAKNVAGTTQGKLRKTEYHYNELESIE